MSSDNRPTDEELVVKARYFISEEIDKSNLRRIQNAIIQILRREGYRQKDGDQLPFDPVQQTMDFLLLEGIPVDKNKSLIDKARDFFESNNREQSVHDITKEEYLDGLGNMRDDLPFRLIFYFKPYEEGNIEGYAIEIESIPVLLRKSRQLPLNEDYSYNTADIVSQNKREIKRIMGRLGLEPLHEPYTEAETLETELNQAHRKHFSQIKYGGNILQYLDEGDTCFQRDLYHAALNCYVHAIEWTIITYLNDEDGKDVIKEQKQNKGEWYYFKHLVSLLEGDSSVKQITMESLKQYKDTERHWIAHHREGGVQEIKVKEVRETLLDLIGDIFNPDNQPD